VLPTENCAWA